MAEGEKILGKRIKIVEINGKPRRYVLPPPKQFGVSRVEHKTDSRLRRLMMWDMKIRGYTTKEIGKEFRVKPTTVENELKLAREDNFIKSIEDKILTDLADKALKLYKEALDDKDLFVAKDVLAHVEKIADRKSRTEQTDKGISLQVWLQTQKELHGVSREVLEVIPAQLPESTEESDEDE